MTYTLTLTEAHLQTIANALGDVPFRTAAPVIAAMREQIEAQQKPAADTPAADTPA